MRLIMLDTETTGLNPGQGDKMVEIGAVALDHRDITKTDNYQRYLNPGRSIPKDATRIHGITDEDVLDKPEFSKIEQEFLEFIQGGVLVIHNAPFDLSFIMNELSSDGLAAFKRMPVIDTLALAKEMFPNQRNNLNALCDRFEINRGHRELHGALLDAELLGEVYIAMTGGRQFSLGFDQHEKPAYEYCSQPVGNSAKDERVETSSIMRRPALKVRDEDLKSHEKMLERIRKESGNQTTWTLPERKAQAQKIINEADAIFFVSNDVEDSFKPSQQFLQAYPEFKSMLDKKGNLVKEKQAENLFDTSSEMIWAFYAGYIQQYRELPVDDVRSIWLKMASDKPQGYFVYTSLQGGQFQSAGCPSDRIVEAAGSLHHLQCSRCRVDVMENHAEIELYLSELRSPFPVCPRCYSPLRPNIMMTSDDEMFEGSRLVRQEERLSAWLKSINQNHSKLAVIELNSNNSPKLHEYSQALAKCENSTLIRITPGHANAGVPDGCISLNIQKSEERRWLSNDVLQN